VGLCQLCECGKGVDWEYLSKGGNKRRKTGMGMGQGEMRMEDGKTGKGGMGKGVGEMGKGA
jgi:hypothetical protein